jgi:acetolactate synthase-1/2/3 large subunit
MNGAQSLVRTLLNGGVEVCFANPGTSEIHIVAALDETPEIRSVLCLYEGVCTGAADGYGRMSGKPAATLLHLGPGLANGLANLHNARRAGTPVVNIVGDHATYHVKHDAPLTSDINAIAGTVSGWVRACHDVADLPADGAAAIGAALEPPGQVATLIVPADCAWAASSPPQPAATMRKPAAVADSTIDHIAHVLRSGDSVAMLVGGEAVLGEGLALASRIGKATGARIIVNRANKRSRRGAGTPIVERLPYPPAQIMEMLQGIEHLILVGAGPPVSFFAYPEMPSLMAPPDCQTHVLAAECDSQVDALQALAEAVHAPPELGPVHAGCRPPLPAGLLSPQKVWQVVAASIPEDAVFSDEAITSGREAGRWMDGAPPHDWLNITGGAIGQGMPVAIGAAVACPQRKVISMQSDGAAMYTVQSLWTQAREKLDIVTVLFNNRTYAILAGELANAGHNSPGPTARNLLDLGNPDVDWVKLAEGLGVQADRAVTAEAFCRLFEEAMRTAGPHFIEVVVD